MTHRRDNQSSDDAFDTAVHEMHAGMARGNRPSSKVWNTIASQAGIDTEAEQGSQLRGTPSGTTSERIRSTGNRIATPRRSSSYLNWSTWLAAALVVLLIGASMNFVIRDRQNDNPPPTNSIALAPGTFASNPPSGIQVATPFAGQDKHAVEYGPEFACTAEPLTEEQVFDIVSNPYRERKRRGSDLQDPLLSSYYVPSAWSIWQLNTDYSNFVPMNDPELEAPLITASNEFWNCLLTGTSFQVWSLMDPATVQWEILSVYPVIRDEQLLRQHIKEWGPRLYSVGLYKTFPSYYESSNPEQESMVADSEYGSILVKYAPPNFDGGENTVAQVTMVSRPEYRDQYPHNVLVDFVRAADGTWWAVRISYP